MLCCRKGLTAETAEYAEKEDNKNKKWIPASAGMTLLEIVANSAVKE